MLLGAEQDVDATVDVADIVLLMAKQVRRCS